jgi:hypothetical protein
MDYRHFRLKHINLKIAVTEEELLRGKITNSIIENYNFFYKNIK